MMIAQLCKYTKTIRLHALNGQTLWYANCISLKLSKESVSLYNSVHVYICVCVPRWDRVGRHKVGSVWPLQTSLLVGFKTKLLVRRPQSSFPWFFQDFQGSLESKGWLRRGPKHPRRYRGCLGRGQGELLVAGRKSKMVLASLSPPSPGPSHL